MATVGLPEEFLKNIQEVFRKTPVLLIGSGFSCGYGLPGMDELAKHLVKTVYDALETCPARNVWSQSINAIEQNLEAGLNKIPSGVAGWDEILSAIRKETAKLILDKVKAAEMKILVEKLPVLHAPSRLLQRLFEGTSQYEESIHVITTNYDTLLELFCDLAELPLDTGFTGFRHRKPRSKPLFQNQYKRRKVTEKRKPKSDYVHCKTVRLYKPHGSISWLTTKNGPIEVLNDVSVAERAIVVPGPSKYQDSLVNTIFDDMRTEMNSVIEKARALLCIGFGFNDDHLQGIIKIRLGQGMPVIIITRDSTPSIDRLLSEYPHVMALFKGEDGTICYWNGKRFSVNGSLWQLDDFLKITLE